MALTIKQQDYIFLVEGTINTTTVKQFKNHLEFLLLYTKSLTINIDKVTAIDNNGLKVIEDLFHEAEFYNKEFSVIGYGCKEIYESLNTSIAA